MTVLVASRSTDMVDPLGMAGLLQSVSLGTATSTSWSTQQTQTGGVWHFTGTSFGNLFPGSQIPTTGTITGIVYVQGGSTAATFSNMSLSMNTFFQFLAVDDMAGMIAFIFSGNDDITGSNELDGLYGGEGNDIVRGNGGDDRLEGQGGDDTVEGGDGNDIIGGGAGVNTLTGGNGNDQISSSGTVDTIDGGAGNDSIVLSLAAQSANATITLAPALASVNGGSITNMESLVVTTGAGNDTVNVQGELFYTATINGGAGTDRIIANFSTTTQAVTLALPEQAAPGTGRVMAGPSGVQFTGFEEFEVTGGLWQDVLTGGNGNDILSGGAEFDQISGGGGNDTLNGDGGRDFLSGGSGINVLNGGDGDDALTSEGVDAIDGGAGVDSALLLYSSLTTPFSMANTGLSSGSGVTLANGVTIRNVEGLGLVTGSGDDTLTITELTTSSNGFHAGSGFDRLIVDLSSSNLSVILNFNLGGTLQHSDVTNGPQLTFTGVEEFVARGGSASDNFTGLAANDQFFGNGGPDALRGGGGDDLLAGGAGGDWMEGGAGFDTVDYSASSSGVTVNLTLGIGSGVGGDAQGDSLFEIERLVGSAHNDALTGDNNANTLEGGAGGDALNGGDGVDTASYAGAAAAVTAIFYSAASNVGDAAGDSYMSIENLRGSSHNDLLVGDNAANRLDGGDGSDMLGGEGGADLVYGENGNDMVWGGLGGDQVAGDAGNDSVWGGPGADMVWGNDGDDALDGQEDADNIWGGSGNDNIWGGLGNDALDGQAGQDSMEGNAGADSMWGSDGNDRLWGGDGDDVIDSGNGEDKLDGEAGNDRLFGLHGADVLWGGVGDDVLDGGIFDDLLIGGEGLDQLWGGSGNDVFWMQPGWGVDVIYDFDHAGGDLLVFEWPGLVPGQLGYNYDAVNNLTQFWFAGNIVWVHGFADMTDVVVYGG